MFFVWLGIFFSFFVAAQGQGLSGGQGWDLKARSHKSPIPNQIPWCLKQWRPISWVKCSEQSIRIYFNLLGKHESFPRVDSSDGSGSKIFDPRWINFLCLGLGQPFMVWVGIWKISPKNINFFIFFPFRVKKMPSGRVKKYLGQRLVGLLFTISSGRVRAHL